MRTRVAAGARVRDAIGEARRSIDANPTRTIGDARVGRDGDRRARVDVEDDDDDDAKDDDAKGGDADDEDDDDGDGDGRGTRGRAKGARNRAGARGATR